VSFPRPYASGAANALYAALFCDEPELLAAMAPAFACLAAAPLDEARVRALANDESMEGRVRMLAAARLLQEGRPPAEQALYGVIVEAPMDGGLDTLAAFSDGGVRYINQSEKIAIFEQAPASIQAKAEGLLRAAAPVAAAIGPWHKPRLPPPGPGGVRMSFLTPRGLCFGQGDMNQMSADPMGGPVLRAAIDLLVAVAAADDAPGPRR